jgi:hypothetical protein
MSETKLDRKKEASRRVAAVLWMILEMIEVRNHKAMNQGSPEDVDGPQD